MRVAASVCLAVVLLGAASVEAKVEQDKQKHFALSAALGLGAYGVASQVLDGRALRFAVAVPTALIPGVLKEIADASEPGNHFSQADLAWDLLGAMVGAVVGLGLDWFFSDSASLFLAPSHLRLRVELR